MDSKRRAIITTRPHVFLDEDHLWVCRCKHATGYGYTWQQARDEWNRQLTDHRDHKPQSRAFWSFTHTPPTTKETTHV